MAGPSPQSKNTGASLATTTSSSRRSPFLFSCVASTAYLRCSFSTKPYMAENTVSCACEEVRRSPHDSKSRILGLHGRKPSIQTQPQGTGAVPHVILEGWLISRPGGNRRDTTADPTLRSRKGVNRISSQYFVNGVGGRLRVKSTRTSQTRKER